MRVTVLGCAGSTGVPMIGGRWGKCDPNNPKNRRTRPSVFVEHDGLNILIDTSPDLREQLLAAGIDRIDVVLYTHGHADHVHGIDDLRVFAVHGRESLPVHVASRYEDELRRRFDYFLGPDAASQPGTTIPGIELVLFDDRQEIVAGGIPLTTVAFPHGSYDSYGFRTGDLAVIVDAKRVPDDAWELLEGARTLVINALWFGKTHPTHFNVEEAVAVAERVGAEQTWLTHLTHRVDHADAERRLPDGIRPAYDGLTVEV